MVNVFEYLDYRAFLREAHEAIKKQKPIFSIRYISGKVGLNPGYIAKVLNGQVHLGIKNISAFSKVFGLEGKEQEYFEELVHFGRAKNESEIEQRFEKLQSIKGVEFRTVADDNVEFYQNWYHMAIRSLVSIYPFDGKNFRKLGSLISPPISGKQAKESIQLLENLKMIYQDENGIYTVSEQFISTGDKWMSPFIRNYQKKTMELAANSLDIHSKSMRDISTATICYSAKDMPFLQERVNLFRQELMRMSENIEDHDTVMQINIQVIPTAIIPGDAS